MLRGLRERFILTRLYRDEIKIEVSLAAISVLIILLLANIIYLNIVSFRSFTLGKQKSSPALLITPLPTVSVAPATTTSSTTIPIVSNQTQNPPSVKEYFITLGTGTNQTDDWTDVQGAEALVDFGGYQNIKEIRFETSISVPTGNESVSVRLFYKTDQHPVWYSEMTTNGEASSYLVSSPLVYNGGSKLYQVQMKTQLKFTANLTQSRLHIVLN